MKSDKIPFIIIYIKDFRDLVGKEVANIGKGLTPDITVKAILKEKSINPDDINFTYVNSATDIIPLLATGKVTTGFVPEPALTVLMDKNPNLKIISNLNDVWKETFNSPQGYPQSTVIVKKDLVNKDKSKGLSEIQADEILIELVSDSELRDMYHEYILMREEIGAPLTQRSLKLLIARCERLSEFDVGMQKAMIEQSCLQQWKSVYPPSKNEKGKNAMLEDFGRVLFGDG